MLLIKALAIQKGDVISLVGAGGKTMTMFRLARELRVAGMSVITTTTTHVWAWQAERNAPMVMLGNWDTEKARLLRAARAALARHRHIFVATRKLENGKLRGVAPEVIIELAALADVVIVEADGARGKSFKAPAAHEPVIPPATTILMPLFGLDALGQPLNDERAFRIAEIIALTGAARDETITLEIAALVLTHQNGALKGLPEGARVMPLLNKVEAIDAAHTENAARLARSLLDCPAIDRVLLAEVASAEPVRAVYNRVAAVILAAGGARRFGALKQLLPIGAEPMLGRIVHVALKSAVNEVVVVLGCCAEEISAHLLSHSMSKHEWASLRLVINEKWEQGLSTSVRAGIEAITSTGIDAVIFIPADMPALTPEVINALVRRYRETRAPIITPIYRDQRGNPVLFNRRMFAQLSVLTGDVGGRELLRKYSVATVEVADAGILMDIDTEEDYEKFSADSQSDN